MDTISHLRTALINSLGTHGQQRGEQELFDELMVHKPFLLSLFDVGPRSQQEQREIESGKTMVNGRSLAVNSDFARQAIFLSQQLDCSERYVAEILHTIMTDNPNIGSINSIEGAIVEFHQRRRHLVDCLRYIFEAAQAAEASDMPQLYTRLDEFVRQQLIPGVGVPGGEITLAHRIFQEIDAVGNAIGRTQAARQNAGSNTTGPSNQGGNTALGYNILNARLDSLKYERRYLATCFYLIARLGYLSPTDIQKAIDWLAANPNHAMTYYILTATLAAFDPVDPRSVGGKIRRNLAMDNGVMTYMKRKLDPSTNWKEPGLKATVLLKWTLFLTETRHRDHSLEHRDGFKTEELETQVWNAVQGDAFTFLALAALQLQWQRGSSPAASFASTLSLHSEQEQRDLPTDDFKEAVFFAFETLVRSLITHASSELRKIKQRQEDLVLASARSDRTRMFRGSSTQPFSSIAPDSEKAAHPRSDIATLYSFIGLLYSSLPPERALQFWGSGPQIDSTRTTYLEYVETTAGKLPAFLQWAVWSTQTRDVDMSMALYDMLGGLAKGQQCSELAYNFLARGGGEVIPGSNLPSAAGSAGYSAGPTVSWSMIFGLFESWGAATTNPRASQTQVQQPRLGQSSSSHQPWQSQQGHAISHQHQQQPMLGQKDVLLAQSFLRLLSTVVTHSVAVRIAVSGHAHFRAIPTLVSLIPLALPLELKGALFETLAAFCEPGAGVQGVEICKAVWTLMERLEVINVRAGTGGPTSLLPPVKGVEVELEEVEVPYKMYPATIPFLHLLSTLIHTPKRIPLKDRIADAEPINTIPESLGQPYRLPGISPFVSFVVDNVFSKIPNREYLRPSDRWHTNDLCLSFIERSLASYDLESLVSSEDLQMKADSILPLLVHPGYDVMKRLLTNTPLQASILSYIVEGVEGFEKEFAEEEPYFRSTIVRVLRIVHRVLDIQEIFIDVLIPLVSDFDSTTIVGTVYSRSYFTRLDQALSYAPQYVPAIAAYVAYPAHSELVLLSVKILSSLSASTAFTNLPALLEQSNDSERILSGFRQIMDAETVEDVIAAEAIAEQLTGAGAPDVGDTPEPLEQAIRLSALEFFIQNTEPGHLYPNVAHFLLLGGINAEQMIQDPHALGARRTCIHAILDLLNAGVPRVKGKGSERDRRLALQTEPLFVSLPGLAERCYRVVYQLCVHPRTSDFTMRYLRTREDFFARQLAAIPSQVPATLQDPYIEVLYNDGSRITTTVPALSSFLRLRSWILNLVALDLHVLTNKGHYKSVMELLDILFGKYADYREQSDGWEDDMLQPFQEVGQSSLRIIDFVQSLSFDWSDSLAVTPVELEFHAQLNLHSCVRTDATGCEIVDRAALLSLLTAARRALHAQGRVMTPAHLDQLSAETTYILESCAVENHRREIRHATATGYEAWRGLLDTTLVKCFTRLPHDQRENMLFDLLHVLPATIRSSDVQESTAILLSEVILSSMTKLREDRSHQIMVQAAGGDAESGSLPAERLYAILRSILECIMDNNRVELVRGNLYATLINYVHLIASSDPTTETSLVRSGRTSMSLAASISREEFMFSDSQSSATPSQSGGSHNSASALESGSLAIIKNVAERLVATISRDAIDGTEVWKTIAFVLLDSLIQLSCLEKQHVVLSALVRHGILSNFVRGLREADVRLQYVLKPDPDDLNPLYVYEAKMSLFIRMAQTRAGAERLLEAQILPTLAQCDYLDARPEADQSFMDQDTFLPSAIQRYHQLFMPALQVVEGMLTTLGSRHKTIINQALEFLSSHRDTVVILLKNESDDLPLSVLEEIHLLVSLCANVLPLIPKSELLSTNIGFGGIHGAILGLAAKCLRSWPWTQSIKPQTDAEIFDASVYASGLGSETKFNVHVREKERRLRKAIVVYIGTASEFTEPEITVVLSPVTTILRQDNRSSTRFPATVPTVGDAVEALNDLCDDLADTLKQIADLSAELASKDDIRVDNIQEIVSLPDANFLQDLDIRQKKSLICGELGRMRSSAKSAAKALLSTLEMLLLILWRHLVFYSEEQHINNPQLGASISMRFLSSPDAQTFQSEVGKKIAPALQRLSSLDLSYDTLGSDWRSNQGYVEIMCRRLRDIVNLHDSSESGLDGP